MMKKWEKGVLTVKEGEVGGLWKKGRSDGW
jgi:hypothetical protein